MIPQHYFSVICCPACRGELSNGESLTCSNCRATYPVADGIPVLLAGSEDEVSRHVADFYSKAWKRDDEGALIAKKVHEDTTEYGQRYSGEFEKRVLPTLQRDDNPSFFLDAACGAQPRVEFGRSYQYHACVDFSLGGLRESRRLLGDRAVCVNGSLLQLPFKDHAFDGIIASHCLYHIDKDLQGKAAAELVRVLGRGTLLILYANPERRLPLAGHMIRYASGALMMGGKLFARPDAAPGGFGPLYTYLHPPARVFEMLSADPKVRTALRSLGLFTRHELEPLFRSRFGARAYRIVEGLERRFAERPDKAYFVAYVATRDG